MKKVMCSRCKSRPAVIFISKIVDGKTVPEGLCVKCAMEMNVGPIKQMLDSMGISEDDIDSLDEQFDQLFPDTDDENFETGGSPTVPPFLQGLISNLQETMLAKSSGEISPKASSESSSSSKPKSHNKNDTKKEKKRKFLSLYCTDLTKRAHDGEIDTIIGRDKELSRVIQILCRRSKNNPCLIGEPGVGKTAIAEGLALRIALGEVPAKLADKEIFLLDLTALVAGTQFRGQFESRIKSLIDEVKDNGNIILFIDEVHNLVVAGEAEGSMNAANILKPALSRGVIQVVGATTFTEYRKHIEKDSALERRFQPVKIDEPSIDDASEILIGIKGFYETFHRVKISDTLVKKAVVLSERYITDRFLPDKAIDLLDEACTCANLRNKAISDLEISEKWLVKLRNREDELMSPSEGEPDYAAIADIKSSIVKCEADIETHKVGAADNAVTEADLAKVIELWTGIPSSKIIESDLKRLACLEDTLKARIIGQDDAIKVIANAVKRSRVQVSARRSPASFIFVGPTGVGKTELVKQLSKELFDTPETLIRLDMSEYMEKHSVSKIIGSPPGYVGYDEAGQLTEKVRRKPYSVILFDEIEKAHPDVLNILLQILDEGRITDAQGRTVNFENTIIVMTSNAGSDRKGSSIGFDKEVADLTKDKVMKALSEFLRPEFLGRVDEVAVFNTLTQENYESIAGLLLTELKDALADKPLILKWTCDVPAYLAKKAIGGTRGARDLCILIRREIEDKLANIIIETTDNPASAVAVEVVDGELKFSWL